MSFNEEEYLATCLFLLRREYKTKMVNRLPTYGVLKSPISSSLRYFIAKSSNKDVTGPIKEEYLKRVKEIWDAYYERKRPQLDYHGLVKKRARLNIHRAEQKYCIGKAYFTNKPVLVLRENFISNEITLPLLVRDCQTLFSLSDDELDEIAKVYKVKHKVNRHGWFLDYENLKDRDYSTLVEFKPIGRNSYWHSYKKNHKNLQHVHREILTLLDIHYKIKK